MRFGMFMAPFHWPGENPTLALERDLDLAVLLDRLGFHELWVGEHHSGGTEIIPAPELFCAVAVERTRHLRIGTGVVSLPYHNPYMVAHRAVFLDHLTRGRFMLGCGPGQLASDAHMFGIPTDELRSRMQHALDVVVRLLHGEVVTDTTEWYTLRDARLQLGLYSGSDFELAVTGTVSANGARAAGRHGIGLLSMAASTPEGFGALRGHWRAYEDAAAEHGLVAERRRWRCVGPVHIAETREQARADVAYGIQRFNRYFGHVTPGGLWEGDTVDELLASNDAKGTAIICTPDDAIERIEAMVEESGGFGTFLIMNSDWTASDANRRSIELFAQHVMPKFDGRAAVQERSWEWVDGQAGHFAHENLDAMLKAGLIAAEPRS
jgi:limonene 1,2-monooxygenase